jgi:hypothetical protein
LATVCSVILTVNSQINLIKSQKKINKMSKIFPF